MSGLLVSVRSATEADSALAGGADLIDVKEPSRGPLGRADDAVIAAVVRAVAGRRPVSAALGELRAGPLPQVPDGLSFVKWGLAGRGRDLPDVERQLREIALHLRATSPPTQLVVAAYADWQSAEAPEPEAVLGLARALGCGAFLLDTYQKDGTTLLDWLLLPRIAELCRTCREAGVPIALAGSLGEKQILELRDLEPTWFAVRGAACRGGRRDGPIDVARVQRLAELVATRRQEATGS